MVDDRGTELLLQDSINYFDKPPDFDQNENAHAADEKGSTVDFRNRVARQWRCPALALKAFESLPARNLFRAIEQRKPDGEESFVKCGDAFLTAVDKGSMSEKKLVTIMMAFQRWRQSQLKNILGQELVKVLEEAREDEIARAALETQLEHTEQLLVTERAKSAMLHSQLATTVNTSHFLENGYTVANATVSKTDRQVMTMEDVKVAEAEIELRDNQIKQLKERIRSLEEKIGRVDGQLNRLHIEKSDLQAENGIVLRENKTLLEQLSSRDKEVVKQAEEMEKLKALTTRLREQQNAKQDRIDSMMAEHSAEVKILQEQLQQAYRTNSCKEVELATSVEHCNHLKHEKGTLLMQLQEAEKRADLASTRAAELGAKLQSRSTGADESAEDVASEMVKHLKKLTQNVRELETSIHASDAQQAGHGYSRVAEHTVSARQCLVDQVYNTFPQDPAFWDNYPLCPMEPRSVSLSSGSDPNLSELSNAVGQSAPQKGVVGWITWKWRWAASSARADLLARKLHSLHQKFFGDMQLDQKQQKVQALMQRLGLGILTTRMEDEWKNNTRAVAAEPKLVRLILSAWRAFTRTSVLQRKALSRNASLGKMLDALPWWIRRTKDRRQLERTFFQWLIFTLSAKRHPDQQPRGKVVEEDCETSYELDYSRSTPYKPRGASISTKLRQVKGPCDEMNAVNSQIRRAQRPPASAPPPAAYNYATPKPTRLGDTNRNQMPRASQTRALQAFQTTLQQEVTELKKIAGQEMQQRNPSQVRSRPVTAPTESSYAKQRQPDGKKVLKSVLGVCNNLALALTNVRGKLSPHVRADTSSLNRRAVKLSPRVLADTVNTCIRNEQTRIVTKGSRRELPEPAAQTSPRARHTPRPGNSHQAWEGWGTADRQSNNRKLPACYERARAINSAPDPSSRYQSPFRNQTPRTTSNDDNTTEMTQSNNSTNKDHVKAAYSSQIAPVQEMDRRGCKRSDHPKKSKPSTSSNQVLNMSVIGKVLGDGATNASLEKKLVGSALARLVSSKISKLRGGQA